jgi:hypothetical protein
MTMRIAALAIFLALHAATFAADAPVTGIYRDGDIVRLEAGVLKKTLRVSGGKVLIESLSVAGAPLITDSASEVSLQISQATPNRNPLDLSAAGATAVVVKEASKEGTDALDVNQNRAADPAPASGQVAWTGSRSFAARSWEPCFDCATVAVCRPEPGVQRLVIRTRSLKDPVLAGVSITLIQEVYDGYPVIRKWVEVDNHGANWIKLENLLTDDISIRPEFSNQTALTPSERGATSSLLAFSTADHARGVIVASEVPSALRLIRDRGASGYNPDYFEWVLGPSERFVSEPTFLYGFDGEAQKTPSAMSLPLDRAVEGGFKNFLREHLGIAPTHRQIPAPQWGSWSNFGPRLTDAIVRQQADIAARCGFALFELDDGWQKGRLGTVPDATAFPRFRETCDYVRSTGMRLGLWVSCFRDPDAPDFNALPGAASVPEVRRLGGRAMSFASTWREYYAQDLLFLRDYYGATYFKQDFTNIKFGDLAGGHDSRTRKESLLRGLRGLLESQAILRRLAPGVANELTHEIYWGTPGVPCDLAALKQAALYHIPPNDYSGVGHGKERVGASAAWNSYNPEVLRQQLVRGCLNARERLYAHRGLPLECLEYYAAATVNWKGSLTAPVQDRQVCSWLLGAPLLFAGDLASLTEENIGLYRQRFDLLKRLEAQYGIYRQFQYSGVPAPTDTDWHWWGKLNQQGCGAVVVLRGTQGADRRAINIPWVDPQRKYKVAALFQGRALGNFTGAQLQAGELNVALPPLGQDSLELSQEPP